MNCSQCGAENVDGAKFCSKCGQSLAAPAPELVAASLSPETSCPSCKAPKKEGAKFCGECGFRFEVAAASDAAAAVAAEAPVPESTPERVEPVGDLSATPKEPVVPAMPAVSGAQNSGNNLFIVIAIVLVAVLGAGATGWYLWSKPAAAPEKSISAPAASTSASTPAADAASVPPGAVSSPDAAAKAGAPSEPTEELDAYGNPVKPKQDGSAQLKSGEPVAKPAKERKKKTEQRRDLTPNYPAPQAMPPANIDAQFRQRAAAECDSGPGGLFCREKVRYRLCQHRWSASPPPGQSVCQRAN